MANLGGGVEPKEMARTFNCGIGMVVVVGVEDVAKVVTAIESTGEKVFKIGYLVEHAPGTPQVELLNLDTAFV